MLEIGIVPGSGNSMNTHQMYQQATAQWRPGVNNPAVPSNPILQPTSSQQLPTKYFIAPMQHQMIPPIHNHPSEDYTNHQLQRMTSTSEEEEET
jgi:hypothetical protein